MFFFSQKENLSFSTLAFNPFDQDSLSYCLCKNLDAVGKEDLVKQIILPQPPTLKNSEQGQLSLILKLVLFFFSQLKPINIFFPKASFH